LCRVSSLVRAFRWAMDWVYNDGGRAAVGLQGRASDCAARAVSIATERPYYEIYSLINEVASKTGKGSNSEHGVYRQGDLDEVMRRLGWTWRATMRIGQGCKVHLRADELPSGRLVCRVSKHVTAVIEGVIHDTHDCSRGGTRCVYGYYFDPRVGPSLPSPSLGIVSSAEPSVMHGTRGMKRQMTHQSIQDVREARMRHFARPSDQVSHQASQAPLEWHCLACTFINSNLVSSCTICGTAKVAGTQSNHLLPASQGSHEWPCAACTFLNSLAKGSCTMCGTATDGVVLLSAD